MVSYCRYIHLTIKYVNLIGLKYYEVSLYKGKTELSEVPPAWVFACAMHAMWSWTLHALQLSKYIGLSICAR